MSENPFANMDGLTLGNLGSLCNEWMKQFGGESRGVNKEDEHSYCYLRWTRRSDGTIRYLALCNGHWETPVPKEALEADRQYRVELAREFREAIDALQGAMVGPTCDQCGADLNTFNDYKTVDDQILCAPCHRDFFPEERGVQQESEMAR
jgi:hypothetical protein